MEIFELFDREVYGRIPSNVPQVAWEVVYQVDTVEGNMEVIKREMLGHVNNSSYPVLTVDLKMTVVVPKKSNKPAPLILEFGFVWPRAWRARMPKPEGSFMERATDIRRMGIRYLDSNKLSGRQWSRAYPGYHWISQ
jgi:hypothetical protein